MFAAGIILFVLLTSRAPFEGDCDPDGESNYKLVTSKESEEVQSKFWESHCQALPNCEVLKQDSFRDLFMKMIAFDNVERLSVDKVLEHAWLKEGKIATLQEIKA